MAHPTSTANILGVVDLRYETLNMLVIETSIHKAFEF